MPVWTVRSCDRSIYMFEMNIILLSGWKREYPYILVEIGNLAHGQTELERDGGGFKCKW